MSGVLHGVVASLKAAAAAVTDAFFEYVSLLLNTTSTNGAQNNTFLDGSTNAFAITRNGNTTQGTFSPFSQTGWSNYFDGTGDYLSAAANTAFDFGSGDFTVELWINPSSRTNTDGVISKGNTSSTGNEVWSLEWNSTNNLNFYSGGGLVSPVVTSTTQFAIGVWYHVAVARSGTTTKIFVNGTEEASSTTSYTVAAGGTLYIGTGWFAPATRDTSGYISNLRIVKGTAVYTSAFTPPTSPLTAITNTSLLTCRSNRFIDNSSNAFAITRNGDVSVQAFSPFNPTAAWSASTNGGSGYFDGTGDYLSVADNVALEPGSSDLTWEMWINTTASNQYATIYGRGTTWAAGAWLVLINNASATAGDVAVWFHDFSNVAPLLVSTGINVRDAAWHHIAVVRNGSAWTLYVDGISRSAPATWAGTVTDRADGPNVARDPATPTTRDFPGYISNLRVVKGTAVYTAAFTPPTAPLTAITNTSLLLNFTNAGIYDSASGNDLETVGNAQVSTVQAKWGTTSMAFDGTGDWLFQIDRPALRLGSGDFTIEGWVYLNAAGVAYGLISKGTATTGWSVNVTAGNKLQFSYTATQLTGATSLAATTWYYFAVVRSGSASGNLKIYLDGVADATSAGAVTDNFNQTNVMYIGADRVAGSALNGYLDDVRITNGYARTISTPTAAFPVQ